MAKLETTLNAIEHNTRFLEIVFQKYAQGRRVAAAHGEMLEALGNIFTRLGEVGVGVIQTVSDVTESIRQGFGGLDQTAGPTSGIRQRSTPTRSPARTPWPTPF
jgi:hypothetical protein